MDTMKLTYKCSEIKFARCRFVLTSKKLHKELQFLHDVDDRKYIKKLQVASNVMI